MKYFDSVLMTIVVTKSVKILSYWLFYRFCRGDDDEMNRQVLGLDQVAKMHNNTPSTTAMEAIIKRIPVELVAALLSRVMSQLKMYSNKTLISNKVAPAIGRTKKVVFNKISII